MFLLSSVRVCVCVFIYKQLFVLRELSCAKLQTKLAGGGTDRCNRVWMLLNIMIFTDLAFIPLSILMSSGNCMLACPRMRGLCWVTGILRSQQHLVQYWFDEAYIIHAFPFTSTVFSGSTLCVTGSSLFLNYITALKSFWPTYTHTSDILSPCLNDFKSGVCDGATDYIAPALTYFQHIANKNNTNARKRELVLSLMSLHNSWSFFTFPELDLERVVLFPKACVLPLMVQWLL